MDQLEQTPRDGPRVLVPPATDVAEVDGTVFLGRMEIAGLGVEIPTGPALVRYSSAMQSLP